MNCEGAVITLNPANTNTGPAIKLNRQLRMHLFTTRPFKERIMMLGMRHGRLKSESEHKFIPRLGFFHK